MVELGEAGFLSSPSARCQTSISTCTEVSIHASRAASGALVIPAIFYGGAGRLPRVPSFLPPAHLGSPHRANCRRLLRMKPRWRAIVASNTRRAHTPTMTLKNAALLALIGTILATVLLVWTFVFNFVNVLRGLAPPVLLFSWFIYAFASFSVAVFFYVFHRAQ